MITNDTINHQAKKRIDQRSAGWKVTQPRTPPARDVTRRSERRVARENEHSRLDGSVPSQIETPRGSQRMLFSDQQHSCRKRTRGRSYRVMAGRLTMKRSRGRADETERVVSSRTRAWPGSGGRCDPAVKSSNLIARACCAIFSDDSDVDQCTSVGVDNVPRYKRSLDTAAQPHVLVSSEGDPEPRPARARLLRITTTHHGFMSS